MRVCLSVLLALMLVERLASGEPASKETCVVAHETAQVERRAGRLTSARANLAFCAQRACPALAREDCTGWLAEVETELPSVVFESRLNGQLVRDVRVQVDGNEALERIDDGTALPIDPGAHRFRFERARAKTAEQEVLIVAREKLRRISVVLEEIPPPSNPVLPSTSTAVVWTFAGVAVLGFASFGFFGLRGAADEDDLRRTCAPHCDGSKVEAVDTQFFVADVSLLMGVAAAGVATWLFFTGKQP